MTVEVGPSLVVLGATWGTLECAYNRYDAINSFLLGLLLAPPVVRYIAADLILTVWDSVLCSWFQFLESWSWMVATTRCLGRNMGCFCACLKHTNFSFYRFYLTTYTTSFSGHYMFVWKYVDLSIIWFFTSFLIRLLQLDASETLFVTGMYGFYHDFYF